MTMNTAGGTETGGVVHAALHPPPTSPALSTPSSSAGAPVALRELSRSFGAVRALDGLSLDIAPGEFVALLGPSGCGKTTALRVLAGFETADAGSVTVDGKDISPVPAAKRDMGMVFQSYSLFPNMSALDNVGFGLRMRKQHGSQRSRRAAELLEQAVRKMIGTSRLLACRLICLAVSKPSIPGIMMSSRTTAYSSASIACTACSPDRTGTRIWFRDDRIASSATRFSGRSSTRRIRACRATGPLPSRCPRTAAAPGSLIHIISRPGVHRAARLSCIFGEKTSPRRARSTSPTARAVAASRAPSLR